jgi:DNA-binding NtrC family response regulator
VVFPSDQPSSSAGFAGGLAATSTPAMFHSAAQAVEHEPPNVAKNARVHAFLGDSPAARRTTSIIPRLANSSTTVLLLGESGTGKSLLARILHESGGRRALPLRVVNCGSIPETLIESELFGHERGAFTGALATRVGAFESAACGTIFLDEIGELPMSSQARLLRVLEERRFERVGSNQARHVEARVIVATNRDLTKMVSAGTFRADLYFRISVAQVEVPPLRDRAADVVALAQTMLLEFAAAAGARRVKGFSPAALEAILGYRWPGNVRELRNVVESAVVLGEGPDISLDDLPPALRGLAPAPRRRESDPFVVRLPIDLASLEARAIDAALRSTGGNRTRAATLLGISRVTLYNKLGASLRRVPA